MTGATGVLRVFQLYNGDTWIFALFLAALAYLLAKSGRENRRNALLTIAAAVLVVFNDLAFRIAAKAGAPDTYYRFLWMIPVLPILACVAVDVVASQKKWYKKALAGLAAAALVALAGDSYLSARSLEKPEDIHYLNGEAAAVCNLISKDKGKLFPKVACDFSLVMSLRLQDPTIYYAIWRDTYVMGDNFPLTESKYIRQKRLMMMVDGEDGGMTVPEGIRAMKYTKVNYIVVKNEYDRDEAMRAFGCAIVGKTPSYTVYRAPEF